MPQADLQIVAGVDPAGAAPLRRHDLVFVTPGSRFRFPCAADLPELEAAMCEWIAAGRPLVAVRQAPAASEVQLAATLPPRLQRQRFLGIFPRAAISGVRSPLSIRECRNFLSDAATAVLTELDQRLIAGGARLGVYGSLAWEALAGESYRHAGSDIDVVCDVGNREQLAICIEALHIASAALPCRLDGEIRFPGDNAVAWREWVACQDQPSAVVLVKGSVEVQMIRVRTLLDLLPTGASVADRVWPADADARDERRLMTAC